MTHIPALQAGTDVTRPHSDILSAMIRPRDGPLLQPRSEPAARDADTGPGHAPSRARTVLVVDDDPLVLTMASSMLAHLGFDVVKASGGVEAVDAIRLRRDEVSCVVCDVRMPGMDGWEVLKAMRALAPAIPVVMTSGFHPSTNLGANESPGAHIFLSKPYRLAALRDSINLAVTGLPDALAASPRSRARVAGGPP